ncbi:sensor histidine kinase [Bacillus sp. UNC41MFS5]|uniref:sensor histidine kinase n=1 Tax=Bacillus sp. UNC41MFS5 TaxID=1449046 RepID=UPI001E36E248|nr:HAMP domain-containing sensor histidine kinase [Bacillus sp. UNC41MFS5]
MQRTKKIVRTLNIPEPVISNEGKNIYLSKLALKNSVVYLHNFETDKVRAFNPLIKKDEAHTPEVAFLRVNEIKVNRIYRTAINRVMAANIYLVKKGIITLPDYILVKKIGSDYYVFTLQDTVADPYDFRGQAGYYTNIPHGFQDLFHYTLGAFSVSLIVFYIVLFVAAFYAMRGVFVPLDRALKKLIDVNKGMLSERIPIAGGKNDYVADISQQINIILERAEKAVLSQQQSAREITHQIRTPLTSILHSVDYFRMFGFKNEKKVEERLDIIASQVERISSMTDKIITLSNLQEIETENGNQYNLSRHINHYLARKKTDVDKITYERNIQEGIFTFIPYEHILQILDSLMENAVKYSFEPKKIYTGLSADETSIQITVRNRGVEIPEDEMEKIFEHSYRAKAVQKDYVGTGLGLAVVKRFVELHKGRTHVTSANNMTTFVVTLPNKIKGKE